METADAPEGVEIERFGRAGPVTLEICTPAYRDDPSRLVGALAALDGAARCGLTIYDDGTGEAGFTQRVRTALSAYPGTARLASAAANVGRSQARNRLVSLARADWILLLDADMAPDRAEFLIAYLERVAADPAPRLVAGGFSLKQARPTRETALHAAQSRASECLGAAARAKAPGRFVFTSNILVHRAVLETVAFDPGFTGWGWEDVDWGLRVAERFAVEHIDNPATHLGLDTDAALIEKYGGSGANFARLAARHPGAMARTPLYRAARRLAGFPGRGALAAAAKALASNRAAPSGLRLAGLKLYRAAVYAEALK